MSARSLKLALAQGNLLVGDVAANLARIEKWCEQAADADLLLTPELALTGYPPEDLLFHRGLRPQLEAATAQLLARRDAPAILLGVPEYDAAGCYNSAQFIAAGKILGCHRKQRLPNYQVFDELRYFRAGAAATVVNYRGFRLGILICEDLWFAEPAQAARAAGAEVLLVLNASPYAIGKQLEREAVARSRARETGVPILYVNLVGGQGELVFDGQSFAVDAAGHLVARAACAEEALLRLELQGDASQVVVVGGTVAPALAPEAEIYRIVQTGLRDYVEKHRFPGVVLGLSGGVDSALTLALAVDALGAERVQAVMMPSRYTAAISLEDAAEQARRLGVDYSVIPIEGMFEAALAALREQFAGRESDTTEENLQSRCRMLILMGISNKSGRMVLSTGNKSEVAVGYATLYGDMAGGFAPLKDCSKMLVYRLARYRNAVGTPSDPIIPERVLMRAPSAELSPGQTDQDSLPPYDILDAILEALIEEDLSAAEIVARGFEEATVLRVLELVQRNEYKRRQGAPGVRVTRRAFGRDWRYPLPNGFHQRFFTAGSLRGSLP